MVVKDHKVHLPVVRSVSRPVYESKDDHASTYEDAIATIDIVSPLLRCLCLKRKQDRRCASLWVVKDACGIFCVLLTWLLVLFAVSVMWCFILLPSINKESHSFANGVVFLGFSFLAVASHTMAVFSNPGAVPRGNATKENIEMLNLGEGQVAYRCPKCVSIKPNRAHHCSVCRRCIRRMDHHCPWINNCVGENNQKFFILFTMYICIISLQAFYLAMRHLMLCPFTDSQECSTDSPVLSLVLTFVLLFESVVFAIFTSIMFLTQLCSVWSDTTGIEHVKRESHLWERKSGWQSMKLVFGHRFSYRWFLPFHSDFRKMESYDYDYSV